MTMSRDLRRVRSAALKHTLKCVFKKAKFESTQLVAVLTQPQELSPVISNKIIDSVKRSSQIIIIIILSNVNCHWHRNISIGLH